MPIDNLSKITSRTGISTTILLEAGNVNATGIITAAGFNGPFTGGGAIAAGIITGTGLEISGISTFNDEIVVSSANPTIVFDQTSGSFSDNQYRIRGGSGKLSLQVSANNGASYTQAVSIGGIGNIFIPDSDKVYFGTNNDAYIQHDNSNLNVINTTGNIDVTGNVVLNNDLKVGTGVTALTDGNVSIGGTLDLSMSQVGFDNPSQIKLSNLVIGQHQNTGSYKIENGSTGSLLLRADMINFASSNGGISLLRTSSSEVQIFAENTARLVTNGIGATVFGELDVTGDVGIGTTNPHKRLHVADYGTHGAIRVEGSGNGNRSGIEFYRETSAGVSKGGAAIWVESDTSTSAGKLRFGTASNAAIQSQNTDMILDHQGRLGIGTTNPQQRLQVSGTILKTNTDSGIGIIYLTNDGSGNGNILVNDSSGVTRVKLDSADVSYIRGGNLGIGSMTPGRALTIQNSEPRIRLQKPNQGHGEIYIDDDNSINLSADSSSSVGTSSIIFRTNGAENVRIKEDKVGIGSTNPAAKLDVFATGGTIAQFGDPRSASFECIRIKNNVAGYPAITNDSTHDTLELRSMGSIQASIDANNNATDNYFRVVANGQAGTATEIFTVLENGFVGIGSTNPQAELDVRGDIIFQNHMLISNFDSNGVGGSNIDHIWHSDAQSPQAGGTWNFVSDGTAKQVGNSIIQAGYLKTSSGGSLFGSVGIGTTDPASNLNLFAAVPSDTSGILVQNVGYSSKQDKPYLIVGTHGWTGADTNWNTYGFQHKIKSNNQGVPRVTIDSSGGARREKFCVDNGGKVGIGTTDPDARLHVYGGDETDCILILESDKDNANDENDNPYIVFRQDGGIEMATVGMNPYGLDAENNSLVLANSVVNNGGIIFKTGGTTNGYTNATERLRIDESGRLLIAKGTASTTTSQVQIGDPLVGYSWDNGDIPQVLIAGVNNESPTSGTLNIALRVADENNNNMFQIHNRGGGNSDVGEVFMAGDVGIGTNNPVRPLHIYAADCRIRLEDAGVTTDVELQNVSGDAVLTPNGASNLRLQTNNTERIRITSGGDVGIGTKAPAVRLDVRNDSGASATTEPLVALHHSVHDVDGEVLRIGRTDLPTIRYHKLHSEHSGTAASNTLKFYMHSGVSATSTRQVLTLQGNGRVGVGTTNGGLDAALEVCSDEGAYIKSFTNGTPARVRFSDNAASGSYGQFMTVDYRHSNNQVVDGTEEGLHIFGSENDTAVRIDGLLRITEQPTAVVYQASGPAGGIINAASDDGEPIHFDHVHINQGGMAISDDNARITVPVPGNYLVSGMISGTVSTPNANDGIELIFLVDGAEFPATNSRIEPVANFGPTANQSEYAFINTTILTLAENDYVELAVHSVGDSDAAVSRGHLSVALLN